MDNQPQVNDGGVPAPARGSAVEMISAYAFLLASLTTLSCCALPALLVSFGLGLTNVLIFVTAMPCWESFGVYET